MMNTNNPSPPHVNDVIERHKERVYRIALSQLKSRADADDVFQDVFLQYMKHYPVCFESLEHEKAWFIRVCLNACKKHWIKIRKNRIIELNENSAVAAQPKDYSHIHYCIQKLPFKYRTVIHLFYFEELSIHEISAALAINENTVKTRLSRAKTKLKERIDPGYVE